jgi:hypothetical protein
LRIKQSDAGASIYDLAKNNRTPGKQQFVMNLNRSGIPSRVMWKKVRQNLPIIQSSLEEIVADLGKRFTVEIAKEGDRRASASLRTSGRRRNAIGRFGF